MLEAEADLGHLDIEAHDAIIQIIFKRSHIIPVIVHSLVSYKGLYYDSSRLNYFSLCGCRASDK